MAEPQRASAMKLPQLEGARFLVIEARYYDAIGDLLLRGARQAIESRGGVIDIVNVPGALEIPPAARMIAANGVYAGAIALGCVIRGETAHYDIVCRNANHWLMEIATRHNVPVGNGILTVENHAQAMARARDGVEGKGGHAARACLKLIKIAHAFERQRA